MRGEVVHEWRFPLRPGNYAYLLKNGNLLWPGRRPEGPPLKHGKGGLLREYDWDGIGEENRGVWIGAAMPTKSGRGPRRESTKTGESDRGGWLPIGADAREWIERNIELRLRANPEAPLLANPRTGDRYRMGALQKIWKRACEHAEVPYITLYRAGPVRSV